MNLLAFVLVTLPFFGEAAQHKASFWAQGASSIRLRRQVGSVGWLAANEQLDVHFDETKLVHLRDLSDSGSSNGQPLIERSYHLFLPDSSAGLQVSLGTVSRTRPALLMFHGAGSDATAFASEGSMHAEAVRRGYVVAYLDGTPSPGSHAQSRTRMWNSGTAGGMAKRSNADDLGLIDKVVKDLVDFHNVDPDRIFASGISNGASMVLRAACERPDVFAAVAPVHGSLEFREGDQCAQDCHTGSGYCDWASERGGCRDEDWVESLHPVFECAGLEARRMPLMIVNGLHAYGTDPRGGVFRPDTARSESFSPLEHMFHYFRRLYGCGSAFQTFDNRTDGDWTRCTSYGNCPELTTCVASGGDWWYGEDYNVTAPCLYKGGAARRCSPEAQIEDWGEKSESIDLTRSILSFFADVGGAPPDLQPDV